MTAGKQEGRVLVVEPTAACRGILLRARELDLETIVVSYDAGDRLLPGDVRDLADELMILDANDEGLLTAAVLALHEERPLTGIIAGFEFYVEIVARLAGRLGLPGLPVTAAGGLRDKALMRAKAAAAGLRVPRLTTVSSAAELGDAAAAVGFPLVLKPRDSAGSVHVSRADDLAGLRRAYDWMLADPRTDLGRGMDGRAIVEEYLDGPELTVEGYVESGTGDAASGTRDAAAGTVVIASVTGKFLGPEPTFVETGHIAQADLPRATRDAIESYVRDLCAALDLTLGPFHCELRLVDGEPVLIEIGARLPGGHIVDLVEIVTGVSLPAVMLAAYTGLDLGTVAPPRAPRAKYAGIALLIAPGVETAGAVSGWEKWQAGGDILEAELYVAPGDPVPPLEDFRSRLGHVIYTSDSHAEAVARFHEITASVHIRQGDDDA
ncbi:ATP-grasp domain-containing protein [Spirillospora sp. NPDC048911]|uniref:ATP-grasp domain-containing protein n=1 Tax=Spirillospora sp. NPDC048911 TaxID=3364527 RepID=UPI0037201906